MAHPSVIAAVRARLDAEWSAVPVLLMNETGEAPVDGSAFVEAQFPLSNSKRWSVGTRLYHEEGGVRFVLNVERGSGLAQMTAWADQLAALFRDVKIDGVTFTTPGTPFYDNSNDNGNYFQASFVAPYWLTYQG